MIEREAEKVIVEILLLIDLLWPAAGVGRRRIIRIDRISRERGRSIQQWSRGPKRFRKNIRASESTPQHGGAGKGAADAIGVGGYWDGFARSRSGGTAKRHLGRTSSRMLLFPVITKNFYLQNLEKHTNCARRIYIVWVQRRVSQIIRTKADKPILCLYARILPARRLAGRLISESRRTARCRCYGDPGLLGLPSKRDPAGIGYSNFGFVFTGEGPVLPGLKVRCHRSERERQGRSG